MNALRAKWMIWLFQIQSFLSLASAIKKKTYKLSNVLSKCFTRYQLILNLLRAESHLHTSFAGTLSWRRCFSLGSAHLPLLSSPRRSSDETHNSLQFLRTLPWRSHPFCPSRKHFYWSSFFSPLSRPPSSVAYQRSWPPCTSHWVLLASGQDCPPFLCALPLRQHTPPIQPYKGHMIGLHFVNTMTPPSPH